MKHIKIGFIVFVATLLGLICYKIVKSVFDESVKHIYSYPVNFDVDGIIGVNNDDIVYVGNVKCGWVDKIQVNNSGISGVMRINNECIIPSDSKVLIESNKELLNRGYTIKVHVGQSNIKANYIKLNVGDVGEVDMTTVVRKIIDESKLTRTMDSLRVVLEEYKEKCKTAPNKR